MSKINKHGSGYYTIEEVHYRGHATDSGQRLVPPDITVLALRRPGDASNINLDPVTVLRVLEQHFDEFGDPAAEKVSDLIATLATAPTERSTGVSPDGGTSSRRAAKAKPQPTCAL